MISLCAAALVADLVDHPLANEFSRAATKAGEAYLCFHSWATPEEAEAWTPEATGIASLVTSQGEHASPLDHFAEFLSINGLEMPASEDS